MKNLVKEMKERRIWRVLVVYPSVSFVLLQAVEFFINNYGMDGRFLTVGIIVAIILLPAAFIWNWRHGEEGEQAFSGVELGSYLVFASAAVLVANAYWRSTPAQSPAFSPTPDAIRTIAVMPFENPAGNAEIQYLCDGIAESLINWLATVPEVRVISKSASFRMRNDSGNIAKLAETLGVDGVLRGKLENIGGNVTVSASLVDTRDETQLWGERLVEPVNEVLSLERSIVSALKSGLSLTVSNDGTDSLKGTDTNRPEAYQRYLRGHFLIQSTDTGTIQQGLDELRAAIRIDPGFARPFADIADSLSQLVSYGLLEGEELIGEARNAAYAAVALAPQLAESHAALAAVLQVQEVNFQEIDTAYEAAVALKPQNPVSYHRYADYLSLTLRFDRARGMAAQAIGLDPLDSSSMHAVAWTELLAGNFSESARAFGEWNRFHPQSLWSYAKHSVALSLDGQCDASLQQADRVLEISKGRISTLMESWLAWGYYVCGFDQKYAASRNNIQAVLDEHPEQLDPGYLYHYALEGRSEELVDLLTRALEAQHYIVPYSQIFILDYMGWEISDTMKSNSAYLALLDRIGFPANPVRDSLVSARN